MEQSDTTPVLSRRVVLGGTGGVAGLALLAACGGGGGGDASTSETSSAPRTDGALADAADVPVGGAISATDSGGKPLIVSQPTAGDFVAFSAICTHKGCTVAPETKEIKCPCHGSTYDLKTGRNTGGPAPRPLEKVKVALENGKVVEA